MQVYNYCRTSPGSKQSNAMELCTLGLVLKGEIEPDNVAIAMMQNILAKHGVESPQPAKTKTTAAPKNTNQATKSVQPKVEVVIEPVVDNAMAAFI